MAKTIKTTKEVINPLKQASTTKKAMRLEKMVQKFDYELNSFFNDKNILLSGIKGKSEFFTKPKHNTTELTLNIKVTLPTNLIK